MQHTTLVLNASYEPLGTVTWDAAISMLVSDKVSVVEEYDQVVRSAYLTIRIPAVVKLNTYVSKPIKPVKFSRASVYARDEYRCQYCNKRCPTNELTYDHVVPRSKGGQTTWENIVSCCYGCNSKKRNRSPQEAGMKLRKQPVRPKSVAAMEFEFVGRNVPEQWRDYVYWNEALESDNGD